MEIFGVNAVCSTPDGALLALTTERQPRHSRAPLRPCTQAVSGQPLSLIGPRLGVVAHYHLVAQTSLYLDIALLEVDHVQVPAVARDVAVWVVVACNTDDISSPAAVLTVTGAWVCHASFSLTPKSCQDQKRTKTSGSCACATRPAFVTLQYGVILLTMEPTQSPSDYRGRYSHEAACIASTRRSRALVATKEQHALLLAVQVTCKYHSLKRHHYLYEQPAFLYIRPCS